MVGIIGCGNMGGAIAHALLKAKQDVVLFDLDKDKLEFFNSQYSTASIANDLDELIIACKTVVLAVKPQYIDSVLLPSLKDKLLISIAAGIPCSHIEDTVGEKPRVIRTMPNLPAKIGKSVTALAKGKFASVDDLELAKEILSYVGITIIVDEENIDKVTAVSGSGPGYLYRFLEAYQKAAMDLGFSKEDAKSLVMGTVKGTVELIEDKDEFSDLCSQVCSKGGTTEAGISALNDANIDKTLNDVLNRANNRAKELAK